MMHGPTKSPAEEAEELSKIGHERLVAGDLLNASAMFTAALDLDPDCWSAVLDLGVVAGQQGQLLTGLMLARRATALRPLDPAGWNNLGSKLLQLQRHDEADAALTRAIELEPNHCGSHHNMGLLRFYQNRGDEAVAELTLAVSMYERDGHASLGARSDLSLATLKAGRFHEGLVLNEVRWEGMLPKQAPWSCELPRWAGESLSYQTILVHAEQGFGDTLNFCRFIFDIKSRFGAEKIIFAVPGSLVRLLQGQCGCDSVIDINSLSDLIVAARQSDYHSPLLSVVQLLGVELEDLPPNSAPYLRPANPTAGRRAREVRGAGFRVGIVWAASFGRLYREKSAQLEDLMQLGEVPGVRLYSLQVGPRRDDLKNYGADKAVVDLADQIEDFADTADLMTQLDLVVSVDTGPFHLAGALGRPAWLMQPITPCWRYFRGVRCWYGSVDEFCQVKAGDWSEPVSKMKNKLANLARGEL